MKRPEFNGPWIATALLLLVVVWGAFYSNPNPVFELGQWAPAANWTPTLHLLWDGLGVAFLALALVSWLIVSLFAPLTWSSLGLALAFALLALAGNAELLMLGWMFLTGPLLVQRRSGIWAATSLVTVFLIVLGLQQVFGTSDLRECLRLSLEPYDFPTAAAERTVLLLAVSLVTLAGALVFLGNDSAGASLRFRVLGTLAGGLLTARLAFLSTVSGRFFPVGSRIAFPVAALITIGLLAWAFHRSRVELPRAAARPPSKRLRSWNTAVEHAVLWLEESFWPGLWRIPVQTGRTFGLFFDYWQGGTPQYGLLVLLLGTLILFWAALKTQVIW